MISVPDRHRAVALIDEATAAGHADSRPVPNCGSVNEPIAAGRSRAPPGPISGLRRPVRRRATSCLTKSAKRFWMCVIPRNSRACRQARSCRALRISAATSPRSPASTGFCGRRVSSIIVAAPSPSRKSGCRLTVPRRSGSDRNRGCACRQYWNGFLAAEP